MIEQVHSDPIPQLPTDRDAAGDLRRIVAEDVLSAEVDPGRNILDFDLTR